MLALRDHAEKPSPPAPASGAHTHEGATADRAIVCATCGALITSARHRLAINGSHEHRFLNPAGLLFLIGCFAEAIGCTVVGPPSDEYPWFPSFAWRIAICGQCHRHLGWHFAAPERPGFFGLILGRLRDVISDG